MYLSIKYIIKWLKINYPEFHIKIDSSTETLVDKQPPVEILESIKPQLIWCLIMCQAPPHLLVCPVLNNLELNVPKLSPNRARLLTSHESLNYLKKRVGKGS